MKYDRRITNLYNVGVWSRHYFLDDYLDGLYLTDTISNERLVAGEDYHICLEDYYVDFIGRLYLEFLTDFDRLEIVEYKDIGGRP